MITVNCLAHRIPLTAQRKTENDQRKTVNEQRSTDYFVNLAIGQVYDRLSCSI